MCRITLILTVHNERGICNSNNLYKIIEQIAPNVIFQEISPEGLFAIQTGLHPNGLEGIAINMYSQKYPINLETVDIDPNKLIDLNTKNNIKRRINTFRQYAEYNELEGQLYFLSEQYGFQYLNSEQCVELFEQLYFLENEIVELINNERLSQTHNIFKSVMEMREDEMIKNIYNYTKQSKYNEAIFLIGAAHKKSIISKVLEMESKSEFKIDWVFNYFT